MKDSRMLVPDFWKGKGRYSKQAICRKTKDDLPYRPPGADRLETDKPQGLA
ncbi:MAG: hypothetical protein HPY75_05410 [Actinobacteria bacterium]|nr:hypothetical protein [Actinomycetota bacterium]